MIGIRLLRPIGILSFILFASPLQAQVEFVKDALSWLNVKNDKRYVEDHTRDITARIFATNKFSSYVIGNNGYAERLPYSINDYVNFGAGFNWRFIGVNLGFKLPLLTSEKRFGKTKSFDLQSFFYFRKLQLDVYAQAHKGFYVREPNALYELKSEGGVYPQRPDLRTRNFGVNAQYIFNNRRFSYRAAFVQNEVQKKSAGSFVLGGSLYYFRAVGDSAIIPSDIVYTAPFWREDFKRTNVFSLSVNAGYAHTFVIKKHFFVTGSITAGPGVNYSNRRDVQANKTDNSFDYQLNGTFRLAAGYNSSDLFFGLQYVRLTNKNGMQYPAGWQQFETGSLRLTLAKRFKLNRKVEKKVLDAIDDVTESVEDIIR